MDNRDNQDAAMATDNVPRRRTGRLRVWAGTLGVCCFVVLSILLGDWLLRFWNRADEWGGGLPPGVLSDYVPEDSAAVLAVNLGEWRETPLAHQELAAFLQRIKVLCEQQLPWLGLTGITPFEDFDTFLISFASDGREEPLLLARGRIDPLRFQFGPDKLHVKTLNGYRVLEYDDRSSKQTTMLALVGDTLVVSKARGRVEAALKQAKDPQPLPVRDGTLGQLLMKLDRRQTLWLAAAIKHVGPMSEIDNYLLKMILRPLVAHAQSAYGGITCGENLEAELHLSTIKEEDAIQLESDLKSICEAAPGLALLGRKNELLPLIRLLAVGKTQREGNSVSLRCRLTTDQLDK